MKIKQIITESAIVKDKVAKVIRHLVNHKGDIPADILLSDVAQIATNIVAANPSTDLNQLINMVKDELGMEVEEGSNLNNISTKRLNRLAKNKGKTFKSNYNKLQKLISQKSGRFDKKLLAKLTNPLAEEDLEENVNIDDIKSELEKLSDKCKNSSMTDSETQSVHNQLLRLKDKLKLIKDKQ